MFIVEGIVNSEYRKDNSLFLPYLIPKIDIEKTLIELKKEHKKAVHFVRASRIFNNNQLLESSSDDGEPKGSSGVPVLNVMRGNDLVECGIIVVRYFGGKLLGVGGLVRSYTNATLNVIKTAKENMMLVKYESKSNVEFILDFNQTNYAKYIANKLKINVLSISFDNCKTRINLEANLNKLEAFKKELENFK
ncbi:YigZ family protein [Helicobacter sp. MIT 14-3879]|uniref:YigZ family protein n=1 Tax=Helicobacter sp. MIT 14-3879 TaxID=2040649 RepID=UPI000E1E5BC1|nr:YigZ family protein [Helicobacter sp. MIT 14-3879]RDU65454.1 hypothetical protein CQA44_00220 [Helicobacter sp. MIT 14-3879]